MFRVRLLVRPDCITRCRCHDLIWRRFLRRKVSYTYRAVLSDCSQRQNRPQAIGCDRQRKIRSGDGCSRSPAMSTAGRFKTMGRSSALLSEIAKRLVLNCGPFLGSRTCSHQRSIDNAVAEQRQAPDRESMVKASLIDVPAFAADTYKCKSLQCA
jgi:hypothetical protein